MDALGSDWRRWAEEALGACRALGGDAGTLCVGPPASEREVCEVERALGLRLPDSFRRVLSGFAAEFRLRWVLPKQARPPFRGIFCGDFGWSLRELAALEASRQRWVRECFPDEKNDYDRVWHRKLAVHAVKNGDLVALDLASPSAPLVYLSHDGGEGHGHVLGADFERALTQWARLGFVGAEDWQWLPFASGPSSGLDAECKNARRWRAWFRLDRPLR